jgi:hypothetical protein
MKIRLGIRWQLASLVLFSSLVGLAVVTIATWVAFLRADRTTLADRIPYRSQTTALFSRYGQYDWQTCLKSKQLTIGPGRSD